MTEAKSPQSPASTQTYLVPQTASEIFHHHLISGRTMDAFLRIATILTFCQFAVCAALVLLRSHLHSVVGTGVWQNETVYTPLLTVILAHIFLVCSWIMLFVGSFHSHWLIHLSAVGFFLYVTHIPRIGASTTTMPHRWVYAFLLALFLGEAVILVANRKLRARGKLKSYQNLPLIVFVTIWILCYYGVLWRQVVVYFMDKDFIPIILTLQFGFIFPSLLPIIFLAGTDFSEMVDLGLLYATNVLRRRASAAALLVFSYLIAVATIVYVLVWANRSPLLVLASRHIAALEVLIGLCGIVFWVALISKGKLKSKSSDVPALCLLLVALVVQYGYIFIVSVPNHLWKQLTSNTEAGVGYDIYKHDQQPIFSIPRPTKFTQTEFDQGSYTGVIFREPHFVPPASPVYFSIVSFPLKTSSLEIWSPYTELKRLLMCDVANRCEFPEEGQTDNQGWTTIHFTRTASTTDFDQGTAWIANDGVRVWMLISVCRPEQASLFGPIFRTMKESFRNDLLASLPVTSSQPKLIVTKVQADALTGAGIPAIVGLAVGLSLIVRRRAQPLRLGTSRLFLLLLGLYSSYHLLIVFLAGGLSKWQHFPAGPLSTINLLLGFAIIVAIRHWDRNAYSRDTDLQFIELLVVLNLGLLAIRFLYAQFSAVIAAGHKGAVAQSVALIVAMGWDLMMSGRITNGDSLLFPRRGRVLMYLGYLMLVSNCVLYYASARVHYREQSAFAELTGFEPESYVQDGLVWLGAPLLITFFVVRSWPFAAQYWRPFEAFAGRFVPFFVRKTPIDSG